MRDYISYYETAREGGDQLMPQVAIEVRQGREPERLRQLISAVTQAVVTTLNTAPATVRVIVTEVPVTHWANGDVTLAEAGQTTGGATDGDAHGGENVK